VSFSYGDGSAHIREIPMVVTTTTGHQDDAPTTTASANTLGKHITT
jgi:hypothetical protein